MEEVKRNLRWSVIRVYIYIHRTKLYLNSSPRVRYICYSYVLHTSPSPLRRFVLSSVPRPIFSRTWYMISRLNGTMSELEREEYYLINRQDIVSIDLISTNRLPRLTAGWTRSAFDHGEWLKNPGGEDGDGKYKKKKKKKWTKWIKNFH